MSGQGELTQMTAEVLDEDLTLLLAKGDGVPRLGIYNTKSDKKKYIHLSWVEGTQKSLRIKLGKGSKEYGMESVREAICRMLERVSSDFSTQTLIWRGVQVLGDLLHVPRWAKTEADCKLIAENKRDTLWFAYMPKEEEGRIRACFIATDAERSVMSGHVVDGQPWPGLPLEKGTLPATMRHNPAVKEIMMARPERWSEFLPPLSKALLYGFSDWSPDGEHFFGDALWRHLPSPDFRAGDNLASLAESGRPLLRHMTAYLRLWPILGRAVSESAADSVKTAEERGLKKRERFEITASHRNDKRFKAMRYQDDSGNLTLGMEPEVRMPGECDRLISLTRDDWTECLDACSLGGQQDAQFACNSLVWALDTMEWMGWLRPCVAPRKSG